MTQPSILRNYSQHMAAVREVFKVFGPPTLLWSFAVLVVFSGPVTAHNQIKSKLLETTVEKVLRIDVVRTRADNGSRPRGDFIRNGSGFVFDREGYILTAAHLVMDASEISVRTADGRRHSAVLIGMDKLTDVAVLRVDAPLPEPLSISSNVPDRYSEVAAIGSPFLLDGTVSIGRIIAARRAMSVSEPAILLQHDAAINPGSSGGPLVNSDGHVVGMNVGIPAGQFAFAGIAFALEGRLLADIAQELIKAGAVTHLSLGATLRDLSDVSWRLGYGDDAIGILITDLVKDGPLANAGVGPGDMITAVGDENITTLSVLLRRLIEARGASQIRLQIKNAPAATDQDILVEFQDSGPSDAQSPLPEGTVGLTLKKRDGHVFVANVTPGSLADISGLQIDDRIASVSLCPVSSPEEASAMIEKAPIVTLLVFRHGFSARLITLGDDQTASGQLGANNLGTNSILQ